jgi:exonuclease III
VSTGCAKQSRKVAAILALQTTIIFLSDIRLNTDNVTFNNVFSPRYEMYHNATSNKRGVGILISQSLQYTVIQEIKDANNNILILRLNVCGSEIIVASIYGPNSNDKAFFTDLRQFLITYEDKPIICAGDWNATYSTQDGPGNIDIINMPNPPSLLRSQWLAEICELCNLSDPFRVLHYNKKEFTFVPRAGTCNRSRLDFFLISDKLLTICNQCSISASLQSDLFDHKSINLSFCKKKIISKHNINPSILNHCRFEAVVAVAATETYLHHADPHQPDVDVEEGLQHVGRLIEKIMQCNEVEFKLAFDGENETDRNILKLLQEELESMVLTLPDPGRLNEISLTCDPDIFLEVLMGNIRNSILSFQAWVQKTKNARANLLIVNLNRLKINYNDNLESIAEMEAELTRLRDEELSSTLREIKIFEHLHNEKPSPLFLTLIRNRNLDNLQCIRKDDGSPLLTDEDREKFIREYFEDIYTNKNKTSQIDYENCISNFLGDEVINHPVVQNSRLTVRCWTCR